MNKTRAIKAFGLAAIDMLFVMLALAFAAFMAMCLIIGVGYLIENGMAYILGLLPVIFCFGWCFYLLFTERYDSLK